MPLYLVGDAVNTSIYVTYLHVGSVHIHGAFSNNVYEIWRVSLGKNAFVWKKTLPIVEFKGKHLN